MTVDAGIPPFTPDWVDAFRTAINADGDYAAAAARWRWPVALVLSAAPDLGYPSDVVIRLDLFEGRCRDAGVAGIVDGDTPFVITGDYASWAAVIRGDVEPVAAIVKRRLHLKGSLAKLMLHVRAARALVACAQAVPTAFPDGDGAGQGDRAPHLADADDAVRDRDVVVPAPAAASKYYELYTNAKRQAWDPADIDLGTDIEQWDRIRAEHPEEQYGEQIHRLCSLFYEGEGSVARTLTPFVSAMARGELGTDKEMFLTSQLFDETKHFEFFARYFREVLGDHVTTRHLAPAPKTVIIDGLDRIADRLRATDEPAAVRDLLVHGITHYMGVVEALLARTGYRGAHEALAHREWLPGLQEGFRLIRRDEGRHVSFGIHFLREMLDRDPAYAAVIEETFESQLPYVLETVRHFDFPHPIVDVEGLVQFSLDAYRQFMGAIGLGEDTAARPEQLAEIEL